MVATQMPLHSIQEIKNAAENLGAELPKSNRYTSIQFRPDIEGLRAIAVSLVVLRHAGVSFLQGGFVGVDVFFVLSGYLITSLLTKELNTSGTIDLPGFMLEEFAVFCPHRLCRGDCLPDSINYSQPHRAICCLEGGSGDDALFQ
jgi:hypothetical protein